MSRTMFLSLAICLVAFAEPGSAQETSSVWEYLARRATGLSAQRPPLPDSVAGWEKQRAELTGRLTAALGLPEREPMKAAVTSSKTEGDLLVEEVAFLWAERVYVSGTVLRRQQANGRQGAVIVTPGWLGHYTSRPYRQFVDALARQGMLVLFIDDPRVGRRQAPYAGLYALASAAGTQVMGIGVFDALRGLDYLLTRADVDAGKIGIAGWAEGALQAYLAAALEPRLQFIVAAQGSTTYESLVQASVEHPGLANPSAFVAGMLGVGDIDRVAACLAPRWVLMAGGAGRWPSAGYEHVQKTVQAAYRLHDAEDRLRLIPGDVQDELTPYITPVVDWLESSVLPSLKSSDALPMACGEPDEPDFSMLGYLQRRVEAKGASTNSVAFRSAKGRPSAERKATIQRFCSWTGTKGASLPAEPLTQATWQAHREKIVAWLRTACPPPSAAQAVTDSVLESSESDGVVTERIALGVDADFRCPAVLVRPAAGDGKRRGVILSHDDRQCAVVARLAEAARRLAAADCVVIVPEHASVHPQSLQPLASAEQPSFYGDEAGRFYGPADAVGLPPLALRVAENLAAFRHLAGRSEIDPAQIVVAGLGLGSLDASIAALVEERIAGVAAVDVTTLRDWAVNVAPRELHFFHLMPYLPSLADVTDWDCVVAAIAPRPVVMVRLTDGWPRSGFDQLAERAASVFRLHNAADSLLALGPRDVSEELEAAAPAGVRKHLIAAARTLVPAPPTPGLVGTPDVLKSRATVDSAAGLIWLVAEMSGYDQELAGSGYRLTTWSFFNDNRDAQKGRAITPLIFRREGDGYQLTGVGKTRSNAGTGLQTFEFEPAAGTDEVGDGYYFGWYDGDAAGPPNAGVVEFEDAPDARMVILTADGQMGGQRVQVGKPYRPQSEFRRQYSITAVSKKP